jgi:hypothetical protein
MAFGGPIPTNPDEAWHGMWIGAIVGFVGLTYLWKIRGEIPRHQRSNVPFVVAVFLFLIGLWIWSLVR